MPPETFQFLGGTEDAFRVTDAGAMHMADVPPVDRPFRSFVKGAFPNVQIVADKFHVVRLPTLSC